MTTGTTTPAAVATCETPLFRQGAQRPCGQVVGLRSWYDSAGTLHRACSQHVAGRLHRYPESDPPEPDWLHESPEWQAEAGVGYHDWQAASADAAPVAAAAEPPACPTCAQADCYGPPHTASARCESGRRPHCSCDVCY